MSESIQDQNITTEKQDYHAPAFQQLGSVSELTQTSSPPPFSGADGGSFPNNYAS